ncbi:hypothetical protein ABES38_08790 [Bacillus gobiensis]|uniref:hypothetical protein n=1 Tax=Bacillus gobiensis TaxID=1441095 RepID=UPI003D224463
MQLFSDVHNPKNIKNRIGQFVAHKVIKKEFGKAPVSSSEEINSLDRFDLAEGFIEVAEEEDGETFQRDLGDNYNTQNLIKDIALYIDVTIPKAFNKHAMDRLSYSIEGTNLTYYFNESKELAEILEKESKEFFARENTSKIMTDKQFKYLNSLLRSLGLSEIKEQDYLTLDEAGNLIALLRDLKQANEKCRDIILKR